MTEMLDTVAEPTRREAMLDKIAAPNPAFTTDAPDPGSSYAPYRVYNIGNHTPVELMAFIGTIEKALGLEAKKNFLPMQNGDVVATYADVEGLKRDVGFEPKMSLTDGIERWVTWYRTYQSVAGC